jgi:rare lipoprotein A (peptidoglycan hydrolase)
MIRSAARILPAVATMMMAATAGRAATPPAPATAGWEESGEASWYGGFHHGRRTSSGAVFDMNGMTAAHESLPLGSKVRVTVQDTGASVIVTITDRQPHKNFRVIDLARGAASRLGMLHRGTAMVTLSGLRNGDDLEEVAEAPDAPSALGAPTVGATAGAVSRMAPRRRAARRPQAAGRLPANRLSGPDRPCCREASVIPVRHSARRPAAQRML